MNELKKSATLCYIINEDNQILLIMKKRGFGQGMYNGPGGKVEAGETPLESAIREVKEETGLEVKNLIDMGFIEFYFPEEKSDWNQKVHIYLTREYEGDLIETEEALPQWFDLEKIPYDQMWDDDQYWYPEVLAGKIIKKRCYFDDNNKVIKFDDY